MRATQQQADHECYDNRQMVGRLKAGSARLLDHAMAKAIRFQVGRSGNVPSWEDGLARIAALEAAYPQGLDDAEFYPQPAPVLLRERAVSSLAGARSSDWSWTSTFEPWAPQTRARYLSRDANRTGWARFHDAGAGAPVLIVQHGFLGGYWPIEERKFHVAAWIRRGFSVLVPLLPFHGLRAARSLSTPPPFPGHDLLLTVEGFRQVVFDFRTLRAELTRRGASAVIGMGMSLGAYSLALWATLDPLDHLALFTPASSMATIAHEHGQLGVGEVGARLAPLLEAALAPISPLARTPRLDGSRVMVVAGAEDRITPERHAARFAEHFHGELLRIPGGHLLQFGRARALGVLHRRLLEQRVVGDGDARADAEP